MAKKKDKDFILERLVRNSFIVVIIGDTPLMTDRLSVDGLGKKPKKQLTPKEIMERATYHIDKDGYEIAEGKRYGIKAAAFHRGLINAFKYLGIEMKMNRGVVCISNPSGGDFLEIRGSKRELNTQPGRNQGKGAVLFHRPLWKNWWVELKITYADNAKTVTYEQILTAIDYAGFSYGVGAYRPENNGHYGRYHLADEKEITRLKKRKKEEGGNEVRV